MSSAESEKGTGEHPWALVGRRLTRPCRQWTFYVVLILGILILGYLAVWIEVGNVIGFEPSAGCQTPNLEPLQLAYATAILAVGVPCLMQLGLTLNKMALVLAFILAFSVLFFAYRVSGEGISLSGVHFYGLFGLLVATMSWWLANGEDELFQDRPKPSAPSGGDPTRELPGGNSGVKV